MVSVTEGLILGASGLVSRQMKHGERGGVPASRTFAETLNARPADAPPAVIIGVRRANGETAGPKNLTLSS